MGSSSSTSSVITKSAGRAEPVNKKLKNYSSSLFFFYSLTDYRSESSNLQLPHDIAYIIVLKIRERSCRHMCLYKKLVGSFEKKLADLVLVQEFFLGLSNSKLL